MHCIFYKMSVCSIVLSGLFLNSSALVSAYGEDSFDPYAIQEVKIEEIPDPARDSFLEQLKFRSFNSQHSHSIQPLFFQDLLGEINPAGQVLDQIINFGKKLWALVENNRAVIQMEVNRANALPRGIEDWQAMQGWNVPISKMFQASYFNFLGSEVIHFNYRLVYTYGGNADGKGLYLANILVVPAELTVRSGYSLNANVSTVITNAGTREAPVAAAEILVSWTVEGWFKRSIGSQSLYVRGDGYFENLGESAQNGSSTPESESDLDSRLGIPDDLINP